MRTRTGVAQVAEGDPREDVGVPVGGKSYRPESYPWFPWIPCGSFIYAAPLKVEEQTLRSGIVAVMGQGTNPNWALVVAVGAGEFVPGVGFVSPSSHYGIHPGDIIHYSDVGPVEFLVDGQPYLELEFQHIRAFQRSEIGLARRARALREINEKLRAHEEAGDNAGQLASPDAAPRLPANPFMQSVEENTEKMYRARGTATKVQVVVPGMKE